MRRIAILVALVVAASIALMVAGPGALLPFRAAAQAVEDVSVAFVVDFGSSIGVKVACVTVPNTDTEYQALDAFTQQENEAAPTYSDSGLLCSIYGVPTSGCGQADGSGFIYWAYWLGDSGSWKYATTGASGTVHSCNAQGQDCDVEGWKFENPGAGNPSDPPPSTAPDYAAICAATPPPTSTVPTTTTTLPTTTTTIPTTTATTTTTVPMASTSPGDAQPPSQTEVSSAPPASLALTGPGYGFLWMARIGAVLVLLGAAILLAAATRFRRLRGWLVGR